MGNDDSKHSRHCFFSISTHVPTWGTTDTAHRGNQSNAEFQSTFPRGERQFSNSDFDVISSFQSTFPRGERRCNNFSTDDTEHFNPRSHVGNDQTPITEQYKQGYFNPRSHVGNDESPQQSYLNSNISIHVPTWGTTRTGGAQAVASCNFNPRSHVGND